MDRNLVVRRVRERGWYPLVYVESQQSPVLRAGAAARGHQAPSRVGEGTVCILERVLEAQARKWAQRASALQGISQKEREREREREREKE